MGVFDDDSSEDEKKQSNLLALHGKEEEEEEDPLESFMKSLEQSSTPSSKNKKARLDFENEEEATSHWMKKESKIKEEDKNTKVFGDMNFHKEGTSTTVQNREFKDEQEEYEMLKKSKKMIQPLPQLDLFSQDKNTFFKKKFYFETTEEGKKWREDHGVSVTNINENDIPDPITSFAQLKLLKQPRSNLNLIPDSFFSTIDSLGYKQPTPVQSQCLPAILAGFDLLATALTGSGKTLSFVWPLLIHATQNANIYQKHYCSALIFAPTRELAIQIYNQTKKMSKPFAANILKVIGGDSESKYSLFQNISKKMHFHLVVSTPGRFMDLCSSFKKIQPFLFRGVSQCVLDEADRMLEMGFEEQVTSILKNLSSDCQRLFFSATFPKRVQNLAKTYLSSKYLRIAVETHTESSSSNKNISHHPIILPTEKDKFTWLTQMLPILLDMGRIIIFVATKDACDSLSTTISNLSFTAFIQPIHGDKTQQERSKAIKIFKSNPNSILIATDVASRGLDIPNVTTVINYDVPKNIQVYTHRCGRTGRLNQKTNQVTQGQAYTLLIHKSFDFANLLHDYFAREELEIDGELLNLAKKSKYFHSKKRSFHGIGWIKS